MLFFRALMDKGLRHRLSKTIRLINNLNFFAKGGKYVIKYIKITAVIYKAIKD